MKLPRSPAAVLAATGLALALAACGGSDPGSSGADTVAALSADHKDVQVIEDWADALSSGDVVSAATYFSLPVITQNGTSPETLTSESDIVAFNEALPCGAKLVKAKPLGRYIAATFRLTERDGGDCGAGAGGLARTAFVIDGGKITEWRRLPDAGAAPVVPGSEGDTPVV